MMTQEGLVMIQRTIQTSLRALAVAIILTQPVLACMDHDDSWTYEEYPEDEEAPEEESPPSEERPVVDANRPVTQLPTPPVECASDQECPSGLLCEPVACCTAEDCVCPAAVCEAALTGAQGRECEADADCGDGFTCISDGAFEGGVDTAMSGAPAPLYGWCEALQADPVSTEFPETELHGGFSGCQGGTDHGLPLSVALMLMIAALVRKPLHD